jgi:hypothetical protein
VRRERASGCGRAGRARPGAARAAREQAALRQARVLERAGGGARGCGALERWRAARRVRRRLAEAGRRVSRAGVQAVPGLGGSCGSAWTNKGTTRPRVKELRHRRREQRWNACADAEPAGSHERHGPGVGGPRPG